MLIGAASAVALANADFPDCSPESVHDFGPFGDMVQLTAKDEEGKDLFAFHPQDLSQGPFPVMVFSHGSTGEWLMYKDAFQRYVSHGFVVIFPHIKSPEDDIKALTTDPMGGFTIKGYNFARSTNEDASSPLHGALDTGNIVLVGHSMGASSTILATHKLDAGSVKMAYAQHPGICGPFGPPPCLGPGPLCNTWMPEDFKDASSKVPMVLSTATNDGAFWPAPQTAEHELGCFHKSTDGVQAQGTAFVQFSEAACQDDGQGGRDGRTWSNGGHDCPMKGNSVETPWVLVAAKLYGQLGGDANSRCHTMLWGDGEDSIRNDGAAEQCVVNGPQSATVV